LKIRGRIGALALAIACLAGSAAAGAQNPAESEKTPAQSAKKKVSSAADLPLFSYPLSTPPSVLLTADDATFNAFARRVLHDIESILGEYDIADKSTLRQFYMTKLNVELLTGENQTALATCDALRALQDKPQGQAGSALLDRPLIQARLEANAASGPGFEKAFREKFLANLNRVEWKLIQDRVKSIRKSLEIATPDLVIGSEKESLDPAAAKSGSIDLAAAQSMIEDRTFIQVVFPVKAQALPVLADYIAAHNIRKPDIWAAREVTFTRDQKLTPVRIGIWDTGVDTSLFPDQLFTDPNPGAHSPHGLAFDQHGNLYDGDLKTLTPEQKEWYPTVIELQQGLNDLFNSVDSPAAAEAKKTLSSMPPEKAAEFMKRESSIFDYLHGTHVAGIAVRGNPAARIVVVQFDDSIGEEPFPPTLEWARKFKADFQQVGEYFRANNVRVVNMSWADNLGEFEYWLSKTSAEKDPAARKQLAEQLFAIWREGIEGAIRGAPNTLFVCAAGNSNSDTSFNQYVPTSLHFPNLIAVGAVDQAGEETMFTSYGDTVVVHANGFQVESVVPGGKKVRFTGTSMASPNVVNLAAKLIALDPSLTPEQTVDLIKRGSDTGPGGRIRLINPKATVALLKNEGGGK
jgi:hypothetical protein